MIKTKAGLLGGILAIALGGSAMSTAALAQSAADLGKSLTPLGAEKAGNKDGTIPEWTGGLTAPPAGYKPGMHYIDPFAADKPLFTIDASNMAQYADKLTEGHKALFKTYGQTYKMAVYPTRRSASYPKEVYDAIMANATNAKLVANGSGVEGAKVGSPFPIPKEGVQAVWNHLLRWRGLNLERTYGQANPLPDGAYTMITINEKVKFLYNSPEGARGNTSIFFLQEVTAPARLAGEVLLVHESMNQLAEPRNAWTYNPGQRRVRRAPNVAYDNPGTAADGLRTSDQLDLYNGSPDRYNWKLVGKKEMYVPYNAYKMVAKGTRDADIIKPKHINQELARYELHRVWVVEGELKPGTSHIYAKRRFYLDEDSWLIVAADQYDARGQLWRVSEYHGLNYYELPTYSGAFETHYDLQSGRYTVSGFIGEGPPYDNQVKFTENDFSPDGLRRAGVR
ncbi:MAG TPA: DUF1329 domain-containing protein [Azospirillaceae bacterium]|nr:DUF1329 domain-containing protein [Azospirillaceae bacterium]